jgi:hypothetical protein
MKLSIYDDKCTVCTSVVLFPLLCKGNISYPIRPFLVVALRGIFRDIGGFFLQRNNRRATNLTALLHLVPSQTMRGGNVYSAIINQDISFMLVLRESGLHQVQAVILED